VAADAGTRNEIRSGITRPAHRADERTTLTGALQRLRDLVAWKVEGAADETLYATATPGGMVIPGVIRHLAGEVGLTYDWSDDDGDGEFHVTADVPVAALLDAYRVEQARCNAVVDAAPSLDAISTKGERSLRWILVHMIQETARHLGHIDALRERADGSVGEEPE
jgi:hypothetical protein